MNNWTPYDEHTEDHPHTGGADPTCEYCQETWREDNTARLIAALGFDEVRKIARLTAEPSQEHAAHLQALAAGLEVRCACALMLPN